MLHIATGVCLGIIAAYYILSFIHETQRRRGVARGMAMLYPAQPPTPAPKPPAPPAPAPQASEPPGRAPSQIALDIAVFGTAAFLLVVTAIALFTH